MPRPRSCRRVWRNPSVFYFKPAGIPLRELEEIILCVDEFEALRLADRENAPQNEAAKKMGVSQPTFSRILVSARSKVAEAITAGKAIRIAGGVYSLKK